MSENNQVDNNEISLKEFILKLKDWFYYFKSKAIFIFKITLLGSLLALIISLFEKPDYRAVLTFAMEEDKSSGSGGLTGALGLASSFGIDIGAMGGGGAFAASNITELMKSRLLVEKTLLKPIKINSREISLAEYYIQFRKLRNKWKRKPELKNVHFLPNANRVNFSLQQDSVLELIYKELILLHKEGLSLN